MSQPTIFFAHRTSDREKVIELQEQLKKLLPDLGYQDLSKHVPSNQHWKDVAGKLIDSADAVICIVGPTTHESEPVAWEIKRAVEAKRPLFISVLEPSHILPSIVRARALDHQAWEASSLAASLGAVIIQRAVFNSREDIQSILSQYGIMVESWESLINRRQGVNQLYLSATAALVAAIGGLVGLAKDLRGFNIAIAVLILASLGLLLCWNWRRTISSYGILSQAKSKVISAMETVLPVRLFDAEWKVLQHKMYTSTTQTDKRTIEIFMGLFGSVSLLALAFISGAWH